MHHYLSTEAAGEPSTGVHYTLYVMVDEFCQSQLPVESHRGPQAALTRSEVVTLGLFGQWACFPSERAFYRYAQHHLRAAFPTLPHRTQFNRLLRRHYGGYRQTSSGHANRCHSRPHARSWRSALTVLLITHCGWWGEHTAWGG
jgi:hypothetical protein